MKDQTYDPATVNELVKDVSRSIHQLMKNFQLPRYKIVIQTSYMLKNLNNLYVLHHVVYGIQRLII